MGFTGSDEAASRKNTEILPACREEHWTTHYAQTSRTWLEESLHLSPTLLAPPLSCWIGIGLMIVLWLVVAKICQLCDILQFCLTEGDIFRSRNKCQISLEIIDQLLIQSVFDRSCIVRKDSAYPCRLSVLYGGVLSWSHSVCSPQVAKSCISTGGIFIQAAADTSVAVCGWDLEGWREGF